MRICLTPTSKETKRETDRITIAGNHLRLTSEHTAKAIEKKAKKVLGLLNRGVKFTPTQPDVMAILKKLRL